MPQKKTPPLGGLPGFSKVFRVSKHLPMELSASVTKAVPGFKHDACEDRCKLPIASRDPEHFLARCRSFSVFWSSRALRQKGLAS